MMAVDIISCDIGILWNMVGYSSGLTSLMLQSLLAVRYEFLA